jgi:hypothetical protein
MSETNRCEGPPRTPNYYEDEPSEPLGAQCKNASSDASKLATQTNDDAKLRDYLRTKAIDPPLEDDVIGNMIPGALVGGAAGAIHGLAAREGAAGVAHAALAHATKDVAYEAGAHAAAHAVHEGAERVIRSSFGHPAETPEHASPVGPGGMSKDAASMPVSEPVESQSPPAPVGHDRSPYAPGFAPLRIPEAPMVIRG